MCSIVYGIFFWNKRGRFLIDFLNFLFRIGFDDKKTSYLGRDEFGRMAYFKSNDNIIGEFVLVKITKAGGISLVGEIV